LRVGADEGDVVEAEDGHGSLFVLSVKLPKIGSATTENSSEFCRRSRGIACKVAPHIVVRERFDDMMIF
jgi:hypothetical protein